MCPPTRVIENLLEQNLQGLTEGLFKNTTPRTNHWRKQDRHMPASPRTFQDHLLLVKGPCPQTEQ